MDKEITIKLSVLNSLPKGRIIGVKNVENMDRKNVDCLIVQWTDNESFDHLPRCAFFDIQNGEYCGDTIYPFPLDNP